MYYFFSSLEKILKVSEILIQLFYDWNIENFTQLDFVQPLILSQVVHIKVSSHKMQLQTIQKRKLFKNSKFVAST